MLSTIETRTANPTEVNGETRCMESLPSAASNAECTVSSDMDENNVDTKTRSKNASHVYATPRIRASTEDLSFGEAAVTQPAIIYENTARPDAYMPMLSNAMYDNSVQNKFNTLPRALSVRSKAIKTDGSVDVD